MCNSIFLPLIKQFKNQDMSVFGVIYGEFEKLINFYSARLTVEDARSELTLFFIELLYAMDLSRFKADCSLGIKKYIAVCLRNQYIALSRKEDRLEKFSCPLFENCAFVGELYDEKIALEQMLELLTEKQRRVLIYRYKYGFSDCEIAEKLNIKRQAVNRLKNRAFVVLREKF
ncbi:MAG: sigma-70 family RNA polymerase sigma factor [Clostridia bacterium]|nr:sigma-70 family RNA polymerase sigma factor [Clostridia bacterium]